MVWEVDRTVFVVSLALTTIVEGHYVDIFVVVVIIGKLTIDMMLLN